MPVVTLDTIRDMLPGARSYSGYVSGLCPFHDDQKPSLMAYEDGFFRCLGCGAFGNLEKLYRKLRGIDASKMVMPEEVYKAPALPTDLREQEDLIEMAHDHLMRFEVLRWYLENRGVAGRIETCRLGYYKGWYTIPIFNHYGEYQGMMLRAGSQIQKVTGFRFVHPHGQKNMMYCPDWHLLETSPKLAVVFGMFDALALSDLRFPVVTPTSGQDSFNPLWLEKWRNPIVILPDKNEEPAAIRLAGRLGWRCTVAKLKYPDDCKDPAEVLQMHGREALINLVGGYISG